LADVIEAVKLASAGRPKVIRQSITPVHVQATFRERGMEEPACRAGAGVAAGSRRDCERTTKRVKALSVWTVEGVQ